MNNLWEPFNNKGLHFLHLNINSLLPKVDELRNIAEKTRASVIGITESKLDSSIFDSEINIAGYDVLRKDRNRHGGGVVCYIRNDLSFNVLSAFPLEIENIFIDILLPKAKPFTVGLFYRPPSDSNFLDSISCDFDKLLPNQREIHILGDFNINTLIDGISILGKKENVKLAASAPSSIGKRYNEFCNTYSLKQLIESETRITCQSSSLIDHILTNSPAKLSHSGVIDIGLSDHLMIYCTRKIKRIKFNVHKHIKCRSFKNYTPDLFVDELKAANFSNYENFTDMNRQHLYQ